MIGGNLIALIYSILFSKSYRYFSLKQINKGDLARMLKYSIPLIPNGLMWFFINSLNRPVLEDYVGLAAVGIFAVAGRFPNLLNMIYLLFQQAWIISVLEEAKKDSYKTFYNQMLKLVVTVQIILAVTLAFSGKWIIEMFTSPEFYSSYKYISLLVVGVIFMNVATFVGSNFAVTKESKYYFYSTSWSGGISIVLNFALIPVMGIWGACIAMVVSQFICMVMRIRYSWKYVRITDIKYYVLNSIFLALSIVGCILLQDTPILYGIMVGLLVYFVIINKKQINSLTNLIKQYYARNFNRH